MSLRCAGINNSVQRKREADFCRFLLFHSKISVERETFWLFPDYNVLREFCNNFSIY